MMHETTWYMIMMVIIAAIFLLLIRMVVAQELPENWDGSFITITIDDKTVYVASEKYVLELLKANEELTAKAARFDANCQKISDLLVKKEQMDCEIRLDASSKRCDLMMATVTNGGQSIWRNPDFMFVMGNLMCIGTGLATLGMVKLIK